MIIVKDQTDRQSQEEFKFVRSSLQRMRTFTIRNTKVMSTGNGCRKRERKTNALHAFQNAQRSFLIGQTCLTRDDCTFSICHKCNEKSVVRMRIDKMDKKEEVNMRQSHAIHRSIDFGRADDIKFIALSTIFAVRCRRQTD